MIQVIAIVQSWIARGVGDSAASETGRSSTASSARPDVRPLAIAGATRNRRRSTPDGASIVTGRAAATRGVDRVADDVVSSARRRLGCRSPRSGGGSPHRDRHPHRRRRAAPSSSVISRVPDPGRAAAVAGRASAWIVPCADRAQEARLVRLAHREPCRRPDGLVGGPRAERLGERGEGAAVDEPERLADRRASPASRARAGSGPGSSHSMPSSSRRDEPGRPASRAA